MAMQPADRGLHWQPLAATEHEALFDACERFLAEAAATPAPPDAPTKRRTCPLCGHQLGYQFRRWRGAVLCCPRCPWEGSPH
jgi:hypothetical protein